jgi:hypothetical protein
MSRHFIGSQFYRNLFDFVVRAKLKVWETKLKKKKKGNLIIIFFFLKCSIACLLNFILGFCKGSYLIPFNLGIKYFSSRLYFFSSILIHGLRDKKRK